MKINFISDFTLSKKANALIKTYKEAVTPPVNIYKTDIEGIAKYLGLKIKFADLKSAFGKKTLGMIIPDKKIILCDFSIEPHGRGKEIKEVMLRFTIAHEIAHYDMHKGYDPLFFQKLNKQEQNRLEIQANRYAANILMPKDVFTRQYNKHFLLSEQTIIANLAEELQVSKKSVEYRIKELGL